MSDQTTAVAAQERSGALRPNSLKTLPQRTYRFRVLGMGLAALPVSAVLHELAAPWPSWAWMVVTCLVWPHLAYVIARRSRDPFLAELRNFVIDSLFAGSWVPLMHFNALPSLMLVTVVMADKINTGIRGLWLRSLPGMFIAIVAGGVLTGFAFQPHASTAVVLASLPILMIHTLAVSQSSYKLVRRVQRQNVQLEEVSRIDSLTGLASRRHWQTLAEGLLVADPGDDARHATLMLVDVDRFKQINDRYGHAVGDDVLRGIAECIRAQLPDDAHAGRLGGDEFVVAMPRGVADAQDYAEKMRLAVERLEFPRHPGLRCSISVGLAESPVAVLGLREWIEAADRALYRAKDAGRNRAVALDAMSVGRG